MKKGDYQTEAQARDYHFNRFSGGLSFVDKQETFIISKWFKKIGISNKWVIVDVGAGTGRIIEQILPHKPKKIYAVDSSPAMLKQLSKNFSREIAAMKIKPLVSMSSSIPLKKSSVDLVTCMHLFKHLANIETSIDSAASILVPKGYLIFDALNLHSIIKYNLNDCHAYSFSYIQETLNERGLLVKEAFFIQNLGETIYKVMGTKLAGLVSYLDNAITDMSMHVGTKILILSQKL